MGEFSIYHWLVVFAVVLLVFGPSKLPELGSSLGKGISNFRKAMRDAEKSLQEPSNSDEKK